MTDVEKNIQAYVKEFVLFPNKNIQFFKLRTGSNAIILIIASPSFDVLTV